MLYKISIVRDHRLLWQTSEGVLRVPFRLWLRFVDICKELTCINITVINMECSPINCYILSNTTVT